MSLKELKVNFGSKKNKKKYRNIWLQNDNYLVYIKYI